MTKPQITVYGAHWCPDCRRSKQFLGEHQIQSTWVDIEEDSAGEGDKENHMDGFAVSTHIYMDTFITNISIVSSPIVDVKFILG